MKDFPLGISGFQFSDLYLPERLRDLHAEFWKQADHQVPGLKERFQKTGTTELTPPENSAVLIEVSKFLGDFVGRLFNVSTHLAKFKSQAEHLSPVFRFKKEFLNVRVFSRLTEPPASEEVFKALDIKVRAILRHDPAGPGDDPEAVFARVVLQLLDWQKKIKKEPLTTLENQRANYFCSHIHGASLPEKLNLLLKQFEDWCVQVYVSPSRRKELQNWVSYIRPAKLDFLQLVPLESAPEKNEIDLQQITENHRRARNGFKLTDPRMPIKHVLRETDYCIYCHQREKDSCSHGFKDAEANTEGKYKKNPLGIDLTGCPLDEKISEMNFLKKQGLALPALAIVMLDNPMCAGTGHRICNDCMKGCIFQKQDPVNIPQVETAVLTDILNLPYGVEIYSLLTRFNPLNKRRPFALPFNGKTVLVVGLGPAGYTLAHYLANEGFGVVGVDALKLEPIDPAMTGIGRPYPKPIQLYSELKKELDERILAGFGGVSEYGITVRWDKNFLTLIYLTLARRQNLRFYGGVRFGGTLEIEDAWDLGFAHIALAAGAGRPTVISVKNNLIKGVRAASDFLMSLQLTGAFKKGALANLQVRLPAVVIGGGLTAFDTATETLAYYPVLVERILDQFEKLVEEMGEEGVFRLCNFEEQDILREYLSHGRAIREEKLLAARQKRVPQLAKLCQQWGGVTVVYRKRLQESPAYRLNHEEVTKAMEEGVWFSGELNPIEFEKEEKGGVKAVICRNASGKQVKIAAYSVAVAAGTHPNTTYEKEHPKHFKLDSAKRYFQRHVLKKEGASHHLMAVNDKHPGAFFTSYENEGKYISFYGDCHPDYFGNVVKAMASAKHGSLAVAELFSDAIAKAAKGSPGKLDKWVKLVAALDEGLTAKVMQVKRLAPTIVEVIVKAPYAAQKFQPGQFYRLQNFETLVHSMDGSKLCMEGVALTGAWVDGPLLGLIVLEMGASSKLCSLLKAGDPVVVMGPTGEPTEIPKDETVLLIGGGLGNAVLMSIAEAMRAAGSRVLYFAGYRKNEDVFYKNRIESVTDQMVWCVDKGTPIAVARPQDLNFTGNLVEALHAYGAGEISVPNGIALNTVDRILVIGSDGLMSAIKEARKTVLAPFLKQAQAIGSINSPMQCMMKEVCAQCLQRHVDPKTGEESFIFSCATQDQCLDEVDFQNLRERLSMNSLLERISDKRLENLLQKTQVERV